MSKNINHNILQKIADKKEELTIDEFKKQIYFYMSKTEVIQNDLIIYGNKGVKVNKELYLQNIANEISELSKNLKEPIFIVLDQYLDMTSRILNYKIVKNHYIYNYYTNNYGVKPSYIKSIKGVFTYDEFKKIDDPDKVIENRNHQTAPIFFNYGYNTFIVF